MAPLVSQIFSRVSYFNPFNRALSRDFFRSAMDLWMTPVLAALSKAELTARSEVTASVFFPAVISMRYFFSNWCRLDLTLRLCRRLRALLLIRRSADFVFGIKFYINSSAPN